MGVEFAWCLVAALGRSEGVPTRSQACSGMAQLSVSIPREDKDVFILRPCILILKVAKNFRETFFRGVELIGVEVMKSRETCMTS